jgi:hypothetical protein
MYGKCNSCYNKDIVFTCNKCKCLVCVFCCIQKDNIIICKGCLSDE